MSGVDGERRRDPLLRGKQSGEVAVDLTEEAVVARVVTPSHPDGVGCAPAKWSPSSTVTTNSVLSLRDPVGGEPVEELLERLVVGLQLGHVAGLARPVRDVLLAVDAVTVMRVRDVADR